MSKLYNKILNEVYLIQDFDSWDNTEQTFKNNIENALGKFFVYLITCGYIRVFDDGHNNGWVQFKNYRLKVRYNGKLVRVDEDGEIYVKDTAPSLSLGQEFKITIDDIDNITDCGCMFYSCDDLVRVPKFDTSKVTDMINMFYCCNKLTYVPKLNLSNVTRVSRMFEGCSSLNEETKKIWRIDEEGTPKRYNT